MPRVPWVASSGLTWSSIDHAAVLASCAGYECARYEPDARSGGEDLHSVMPMDQSV